MASGYHARRAPNVSQYLANLNTIPSPHELAAQQSELSIGDDGLDFLTNAEFFDFDALNVDFHTPAHEHQDAGSVGPAYQYANGAYPPSMTGSPSSMQNFPNQYPATPVAAAAAQMPAHMPMYNNAHQQPQTGEKRSVAAAALPSPADLEEQSRMAAEEDKRRRNTAASARFRVKKKQREQALEKQAKEMAEKVQMLEGKVQQLEMENRWLKGLITDKHDGKTLDDMRKSRETDGERSIEDRKDGVGTEKVVDVVEEVEEHDDDDDDDVKDEA